MFFFVTGRFLQVGAGWGGAYKRQFMALLKLCNNHLTLSTKPKRHTSACQISNVWWGNMQCLTPNEIALSVTLPHLDGIDGISRLMLFIEGLWLSKRVTCWLPKWNKCLWAVNWIITVLRFCDIGCCQLPVSIGGRIFWKGYSRLYCYVHQVYHRKRKFYFSRSDPWII